MIVDNFNNIIQATGAIVSAVEVTNQYNQKFWKYRYIYGNNLYPWSKRILDHYIARYKLFFTHDEFLKFFEKFRFFIKNTHVNNNIIIYNTYKTFLF